MTLLMMVCQRVLWLVILSFFALPAWAKNPLQVQSISSKIVFDAAGSPSQPYAMEYTNITVELHNVGDQPIPKETLLKKLPHIEIEDFQVQDPPKYVTHGGYWNPLTSPALPPDAKAQIWVIGHFKSAGTKKAAASLGLFNKAATVIHVLADPGCYSSVPQENVYKKGWAIGRTACVDPTTCITITRAEDTCAGDRLTKYICSNQFGQVVKTYHDIACPSGCFSGACLQTGQKDPRRDRFSLKMLSPHGGEVFHPGEDIRVAWESKGISQVSFTLMSEKIHRKGGTHTLGAGILSDSITLTPARKEGVIRLPATLAPADDWTLTVVQGDAKEPLVNTSAPFEVR